MILLNIQTSPRGSKSISIAATHAFVEAYRTAHPDVTVDNLNVWEEGLPEFDSEATTYCCDPASERQSSRSLGDVLE
jgi:FMN-dependent NADH-azoreductase